MEFISNGAAYLQQQRKAASSKHQHLIVSIVSHSSCWPLTLDIMALLTFSINFTTLLAIATVAKPLIIDCGDALLIGIDRFFMVATPEVCMADTDEAITNARIGVALGPFFALQRTQ